MTRFSMAEFSNIYIRQIGQTIQQARVLGLLFLWGSISGFGLSGCNGVDVSASQGQNPSPADGAASARELQAEEDMQGAGQLKARLPHDIPPAPVQPELTLLSRAATTADSDLLPSSSKGEHQGPFRVGNQTQHPIRLALQTRLAPDDQAVVNPEGLDLEPVHWDFAPGEGGQSGLLMAVPQGDVEVRNGDVLVAFAQDGSRRYWGPYIVGETQLPYWNEERSEWQLLIQP